MLVLELVVLEVEVDAPCAGTAIASNAAVASVDTLSDNMTADLRKADTFLPNRCPSKWG